jgi:nucleoside-diphosphate-sugar epimerase
LRVLVTGATGFIGTALIGRMAGAGRHIVRATVRRNSGELPQAVERIATEDLSPDANWQQSLRDVDTVIHLAARVHVIHDSAVDPVAEFHRVNVEGTLSFAQQAAAANVRRFIFLSSIKVNGEATLPGKPYKADDVPAPVGPYSVSKLEAEGVLRRLSLETGMETVIIRPPLVYGPGVKANFLSMMHWLTRGIPLPLGAIDNRRSLVALDNLVDLIVTCIDHPAAANQIFLAGDGEDLSTAELLRRLGKFLGKPARLVPVPPAVIITVARILGKREIAQRLLGSLQVDIRKNKDVLGWEPPFTVDHGLEAVARWYVNHSRNV